MFWRRLSLIDPVGPPSELAPLSDTRMTDGVLPVAGLVEEVEDPAQLGVGVGQESGEALHEPGRHPLLVGGQGVPGRHPGRTGGQFGAGGEQAEVELAGEDLGAPAVPTLVEASPVGVDPLLRRVVGRVAGARAEVHEEAAVHVDRPQVGQLADGPVGQVRTQVVALGDGPGGMTEWLSWKSEGTNWWVSPPWNPYQRSNPRARGHEWRGAAMWVSSSGVRCHLPTA